MAKHLHIISFNIPYPADYGGVIDVFCKIKALAEQGIQIYLHCFEYGRTQSAELEKYCRKVYYYKRKNHLGNFLHYLPFIVSSRRSEELIANLCKDQHPILFEGLHTCYFLSDRRLKSRLKIVRTHNIEHQYYLYLFHAEKNLIEKVYFLTEAIKLFFFQRKLRHAGYILAISPDEERYFKERFGQTKYLPAFHQHERVNIREGQGDYALYHGDLSVQENEQAAVFLVEEVFRGMPFPLIIAGKNPSKRFKKILVNSSVRLIESPSHEQMQELIAKAHVHVLPTFQPTGIKLKLLNVLFNGRFCVVNREMVKNTELEGLCIVAGDAEAMRGALHRCFEERFSEREINKRKTFLEQRFNNRLNSELLVQLLPESF